MEDGRLIGGHLVEAQLYTEWDDNHGSTKTWNPESGNGNGNGIRNQISVMEN